MKIGGQIPWNVNPICETIQISYLMGRRLMRDFVGNHLKGSIITFDSLVECYPISEGRVKNPSIWKESLTWIVPRICVVRGENLER